MKYKIMHAGNSRKKGRYIVIKMFATGALVSKGFNGADALRFSETENPFVRFRVGVRVYDKRAENNHRFVNIHVKAFGYLVARIRDMKLDAGSYVNIIGRYDDEPWEDQTTREKKSTPVLIVDEIEFCHGNGKQNGEANGAGNGKQYGEVNGAGNTTAASGKREQAPQPAGYGQSPANFTGFEGFGGVNPYFPEI